MKLSSPKNLEGEPASSHASASSKFTPLPHLTKLLIPTVLFIIGSLSAPLKANGPGKRQLGAKTFYQVTGSALPKVLIGNAFETEANDWYRFGHDMTATFSGDMTTTKFRYYVKNDKVCFWFLKRRSWYEQRNCMIVYRSKNDFLFHAESGSDVRIISIERID